MGTVTRHRAIYSIDALASEAGVSRRTIRYYIEKALIPPAYPRTSTSVNDIRHGADLRYGIEHLRRIRQIQQIRDGNMSLADIRDHLTPEDA